MAAKIFAKVFPSSFICLLIAVNGCATGIAQKPVDFKVTDEALRNWALSFCLASTFKPGIAQQDALSTAGAYLEAGNQPIEAYQEVTQLIQKFLARKYTGVTPSEFNTKKCIDLYHSPELALLIKKYSK